MPPGPLPSARRRAPIPTGLLTGRRTPGRRTLSRIIANVNRLLDRMPPGHAIHRLCRRDLALTELDVPLRRGGPGLSGLSVAFLSDLHAGSFMTEDDLCEIFRRVAAAKPDVVCFGGDMINTRFQEIVLFRKPLEILNPPLGLFAVPGNHDHFFGKDVELWQDFLAMHGVETLINKGARVERNGASLWIAGVDDLTEGEPDLEAALAGRAPDEPCLLLSHHADMFVEAVDMDVDLQLSGHSHGGQIKMFGWTALHHSRFGYGEGAFAEGNSRLYVGRGVGVTALPVRIGSPPEIPLVRFRV